MSTGDYFSNLKPIDSFYLTLVNVTCKLVSEWQYLSVLLYILDIDEGTKGDGVYVAK